MSLSVAALQLLLASDVTRTDAAVAELGGAWRAFTEAAAAFGDGDGAELTDARLETLAVVQSGALRPEKLARRTPFAELLALLRVADRLCAPPSLVDAVARALWLRFTASDANRRDIGWLTDAAALSPPVASRVLTAVAPSLQLQQLSPEPRAERLFALACALASPRCGEPGAALLSAVEALLAGHTARGRVDWVAAALAAANGGAAAATAARAVLGRVARAVPKLVADAVTPTNLQQSDAAFALATAVASDAPAPPCCCCSAPTGRAADDAKHHRAWCLMQRAGVAFDGSPNGGGSVVSALLAPPLADVLPPAAYADAVVASEAHYDFRRGGVVTLWLHGFPVGGAAVTAFLTRPAVKLSPAWRRLVEHVRAQPQRAPACCAA
jgi:hypothetical protein